MTPLRTLQPDGPHHDQQRRDGEKCRKQLDLHASRHARDQADERVHAFALLFFQKAQEITPKFLRVEAHSEILHAQDAARIDDRGEKRVVHVAVRGLRRKHAVAARHVPDGRRGAGEEAPAGEIGAERLRILLEHFGRVALRVDGDGNERDLGAEVSSRADPERTTSSASERDRWRCTR